MANEVIAIGGGCIDHLSIVTRTPEGWEQCGMPLVQGGGPAATGATAIARLGGSVELWAFTGDDYHGQMIRNELQKDGVDISQMRVVPGYRSHCSYIEVDADTGERTIYGSGFGQQPADVTSFYDPGRARTARALLVTAFVPEVATEAARQVHANGGKVVADLFRIDGPVSEMVHHVDAIILPEFTVEPLVGSFDIPRALGVLADLGGRMPTITVGPRGCYYLAEGIVYHCPAFQIRAVDTTGCGDSFHGAYAYAMAKNMDQHEAVRFSSAVAGLKATRLGGRSGLPTPDAVMQFMAERPDEARARRLRDGATA
ncbi:MAG: PfkB family carbohydrate kinase [Anaerolineae bacterium]